MTQTEVRGKPPLSRRKKILFRIAAPLLVVVAMLVGLEIVLRVLGVPPRTASVLNAYFHYDDTCGWVGRPNVVGDVSTTTYECTVSHGVDGFRTVQPPSSDAERPREQEEIWVLGDSMVWGWGVSDGETVVDTMNDRANGRFRFRNLGVAAYSALQEYVLLQRLLEESPVPPRMVVLQLCFNDPVDNVTGEKNPIARPYCVYEGGKTIEKPSPRQRSISNTIQAWIRSNSLAINHVYFLISQSLRRLRHGAEETESEPQLERYTDDEWHVLGDIHGWIRDRCRASGIDFVVVIVPPLRSRFGFDLAPTALEQCASFTARALAGAAAHGIDVIDTTAAFEGYYAQPDAEQLMIRGDLHFTKRGNEIIGEAVWTDLEQRVGKRAGSPDRR